MGLVDCQGIQEVRSLGPQMVISNNTKGIICTKIRHECVLDVSHVNVFLPIHFAFHYLRTTITDYCPWDLVFAI